MALALCAGPAAAVEEPPYFKADIEAGKLPPVLKRLPQTPLVVDVTRSDWEIGRYGGDLRTLLAKDRDIRMMVVYGYARLVGYDESLNLVPDILERVDNIDSRVFTLHLRPGHKWSDGHPFTSADFRYFWDDVANNPDLSPFGLPPVLKVRDKGPKFEVLSDTAVRFTWDEPNPQFLPALAAPSPLYIYRPGHYLRQFHAKYIGVDKAGPYKPDTYRY
jgi:peptide/nickel transport system substrate-binding protein